MVELLTQCWFGPGSMMGSYGGTYFGWGMMFFALIFWVLVIVALVLLIQWLLKQVNKK